MSDRSKPKMPKPETSSVRMRRSRLPREAETEASFDITSSTDPIDYQAAAAALKLKPRYENTYRLDPDAVFSSPEVERTVEGLLAERLTGVKYDPDGCKLLSQTLAAEIMEEIKGLKFKRYKLVAVVSIGSVKERPGMQFGSRCLWNQKTDSFASVKYTNGSLFAVAMVYGLYFE